MVLFTIIFVVIRIWKEYKQRERLERTIKKRFIIAHYDIIADLDEKEKKIL